MRGGGNSQNFTVGTEKNHDSQRRDRILHFFLHLEIGQFSPHFGATSLLNCTEQHLEKEDKIHWRKFKKSVEMVPEIRRLGRFCWATVACGVFPRFLPLAITAFGGPEGDFNLAIRAFGGFQFIVRKYCYRLGKMEFKESGLLI